MPPIVALRPQVIAGLRLDELRGDPNAVASLAHAAFENVANPQLASDLAYIDVSALVGEARVACDHEQPSQPRQAGDDVLGDAIGEVFLLGVAAHVGKGEDGDGRFVR
jgi:hypothetical protein